MSKYPVSVEPNRKASSPARVVAVTTCADWVRCVACRRVGVVATHFPRYIRLECRRCGHSWSQR